MAGTEGNRPSAMPTVSDRADVALDAVPSCAERIRAYPWERTPLGALDRWDPLLRATVEVILADSLNVVDLLNADLVLIEQPSLARIESVYGSGNVHEVEA